jgi:hypothetical protein
MHVCARTAALASLAVHGVALVAVAAAWPSRRGQGWQPPVSAPAAVLPPTPARMAAEPLSVVLLDPSSVDGEAAPLPPGVPSPRIASRGAARAIEVRTTAPDGEPATADPQIVASRGRAGEVSGRGDRGRTTQTGDGTLRRGLGMRGPELRLDVAYLERAGREGHGGPSAPTRGFDPAGRGRGVIYDRVTTVSIERDGTAHLDDLRDVDLRWDIRVPTPDAVKDAVVTAAGELRAWYADPYAGTRVGKPQDVPAYMKMKPGDCDHWDDACSVELRGREDDTTLKKAARGQIAHGKAALSDAIMRRLVGDPYASRKLKLLDDTREARAVTGAEHRAEDRARSAELMGRNLDALWRATSDPAARRDALFTLWDECAEGEGPEGEAGQRARSMVLGWIRAKLPAGSPGAFGADELAARAAQRRSRQAFAPYE